MTGQIDKDIQAQLAITLISAYSSSLITVGWATCYWALHTRNPAIFDRDHELKHGRWYARKPGILAISTYDIYSPFTPEWTVVRKQKNWDKPIHIEYVAIWSAADGGDLVYVQSYQCDLYHGYSVKVPGKVLVTTGVYGSVDARS